MRACVSGPVAGGVRVMPNLPSAAQFSCCRARRRNRYGRRHREILLLVASAARSGPNSNFPTPIIALAISPDGKLVAAAGIRGSVAIIDRHARKLEHTLIGPGLPVWSVAFFPDSHTLLTGGADRVIRRWDAVSGEPVVALVGAPEDPLAGLRRRPRRRRCFAPCVACHTLTADEGNKAGPSLARHFRPQDSESAGLSLFRQRSSI